MFQELFGSYRLLFESIEVQKFAKTFMAFQKFVPDLLSSINRVTINVDKPVGDTLDIKFNPVPNFRTTRTTFVLNFVRGVKKVLAKP